MPYETGLKKCLSNKSDKMYFFKSKNVMQSAS